MKRLWEAEHAYYCTRGNYFAGDCHADFSSWSAFIEEEGDADLDYNLIFRWDWKEGEDNNVPPGAAALDLFYVGQRKALLRSVRVWVTREQEPEIIEWLRPRFQHLSKLWDPFTTAVQTDERKNT